jgi:hypothetical protein
MYIEDWPLWSKEFKLVGNTHSFWASGIAMPSLRWILWYLLRWRSLLLLLCPITQCSISGYTLTSTEGIILCRLLHTWRLEECGLQSSWQSVGMLSLLLHTKISRNSCSLPTDCVAWPSKVWRKCSPAQQYPSVSITSWSGFPSPLDQWSLPGDIHSCILYNTHAPLGSRSPASRLAGTIIWEAPCKPLRTPILCCPTPPHNSWLTLLTSSKSSQSIFVAPALKLPEWASYSHQSLPPLLLLFPHITSRTISGCLLYFVLNSSCWSKNLAPTSEFQGF